MTINEAVETLTNVAKRLIDTNATSELDAVKLGVEALLAIKCGRYGLRTEFDTPLLGETVKLTASTEDVARVEEVYSLKLITTETGDIMVEKKNLKRRNEPLHETTYIPVAAKLPGVIYMQAE